ncbi:MAG: amidohydrolase family protein [Rhizobiaceae bacterium]|nr:amidohydrolase family protein [Rhizobiaceae bacterium]
MAQALDTTISAAPSVPVQEPVPPRLKAPAGATDCHMHIFEPRFPARKNTPYVAPVAPVAHYNKAIRERLGLERAVVIQSVTHGADNSNLLAALAAFGDSARGVAVVEPDVGDAELQRLTDAGVRGIRFEMNNGILPLEALDAIAAKIAPFGWHIDLQTDGRGLPDLVDRLLGLPCPVVLDHYGKFIDALPVDHPAVQAVLRLLGSGRGWVKLTAPYAGRHRRPAPWPELVPIARAFLDVAPDRVVWGSEWPQSMLPVLNEPIPDHALLLDLLLDYTDDSAVIANILTDNPAELYDFPAAGVAK